ncbi:MAG: ATP-binding protein [Candidatus Omnitrophica bacterium]|nr:ATP-binding protein [Candidatus Omnitrophota bacterium]
MKSGEIKELMDAIFSRAARHEAQPCAQREGGAIAQILVQEDKEIDLLGKRFDDFTAAHNIGKEVALKFELDECLELLVNRIADLMSVEIISLMLMDKDQTHLNVETARGLNPEAARNKVNVGEGVAGWIAKTGEALLIEDITKDERFCQRAGRYYTNSLLSVPLKIQDRVIGVINVNNKISKSVFVKDDLEKLNTVAELAAAAIENARFRKEARKREALRSDFISNVSHELCTPLTAIKEAVCMILEGITGIISSEQKRFLEIAKKNIERLNRLIKELLDLAKPGAHSIKIARKLFDFSDLVRDAIELLAPLAREKKITIMSNSGLEKFEIWGDADKLAQVITNLLANAIKYNKPYGSIGISLVESDGQVCLSIADTGIGIPTQELENIFDRFYRIQSSASARTQGEGLGLAIAKEIVACHGGRISVASQIDKGSVFTVALPKDLRKKER